MRRNSPVIVAEKAGDTWDLFPFPVSQTDAQGHYVTVNNAFEVCYGLKKQSVIGLTPWIIAAADFPDLLSKEISTHTSAGGWSGRVLNRAKDGKTRELFLITKTVRLASGERRFGMACPPGQEVALLSAMMDLFARGFESADWGVTIHLSDREKELLGLLSKGCVAKEAAALMNLKAGTVRAMLHRIKSKQAKV